MARNRRIFTVYDVLEDKGVFEANPANPQARGPNNESIYEKQEYPKMLYHPEGKLEIAVAGVAEMTPMGPKMLGEQKRMVVKVAKDMKEELALLEAGWHDHPTKANAARAKLEAEGAPKTPAELEKEAMQKKIAELEAKLALPPEASPPVEKAPVDVPPKTPKVGDTVASK